MTGRLLQIGEVAERVGLSLRTVRYYEEMGLLTPEDRTEGGFRLYTEDHVERLSLIMQMKPLGFTVQEMRELLDARDVLAGPDGDDEVRAAATERLRGFAAAAAGRVEDLRGQLARGEEFARQLRRQARGSPAAATARRAAARS
jgi:DNA-binding transcriptional MerR regulator